MRGRHARRRSHTSHAAFERHDVFLQRRPSRIAGSRVVIAGIGFEAIPVKRRCGVNWRRYAVVLCILVNSSMNTFGFKFHESTFWVVTTKTRYVLD